MSLNRLNYDQCQYKQSIHESKGPGMYMLNTPPNDCSYKYPAPPTVRLQKAGNSLNRSQPLIDTESVVQNRISPASKCPTKKWLQQNVQQHDYGIHPDGRNNLDQNKPNLLSEQHCKQSHNDLTHWPDVFSHTIESRHTHPPSTLRGTGFNRWEWLCFNPQERWAPPFDYNISNRIIVKDNHRPCVPRPAHEKAWPKPQETQCEMTTPVCANP